MKKNVGFLRKYHLNWFRSTLTFPEREYLTSGVNMLRNSLKISGTTKTEFFELKFFQIDKKIWQNCCLEDFSSVSDHLTCWLSISVLTPRSLGISATTLFAVYNIGNKWAIRVIFFLKLFKIWCRFQKWKEKLRKYFGV